MTHGPDFYDEESVFAAYMQRRQRSDSPNETLEKPILTDMLGDVRGKAVLDLGCGDGAFGVELLAAGCQSYTGLEASTRMVDLAQKNLSAVGGTVHQERIEMWQYPPSAFDLVISRLALHYVSEFEQTSQQIYQTLKPSGCFVFSVEHPVITSSNQAIAETGIRQYWIVDDYFALGERNLSWMGSQVIKYHRTIEAYFLGLQKAGLVVESLRESSPKPELFTDEALYARRRRIPLFLLMKARRPA